MKEYEGERLNPGLRRRPAIGIPGVSMKGLCDLNCEIICEPTDDLGWTGDAPICSSSSSSSSSPDCESFCVSGFTRNGTPFSASMQLIGCYPGQAEVAHVWQGFVNLDSGNSVTVRFRGISADAINSPGTWLIVDDDYVLYGGAHTSDDPASGTWVNANGAVSGLPTVVAGDCSDDPLPSSSSSSSSSTGGVTCISFNDPTTGEATLELVGGVWTDPTGFWDLTHNGTTFVLTFGDNDPFIGPGDGSLLGVYGTNDIQFEVEECQELVIEECLPSYCVEFDVNQSTDSGIARGFVTVTETAAGSKVWVGSGFPGYEFTFDYNTGFYEVYTVSDGAFVDDGGSAAGTRELVQRIEGLSGCPSDFVRGDPDPSFVEQHVVSISAGECDCCLPLSLELYDTRTEDSNGDVINFDGVLTRDPDGDCGPAAYSGTINGVTIDLSFTIGDGDPSTDPYWSMILGGASIAQELRTDDAFYDCNPLTAFFGLGAALGFAQIR